MTHQQPCAAHASSQSLPRSHPRRLVSSKTTPGAMLHRGTTGGWTTAASGASQWCLNQCFYGFAHTTKSSAKIHKYLYTNPQLRKPPPGWEPWAARQPISRIGWNTFVVTIHLQQGLPFSFQTGTNPSFKISKGIMREVEITFATKTYQNLLTGGSLHEGETQPQEAFKSGQNTSLHSLLAWFCFQT